MNPRAQFVYWVAERELVRQQKERGDPKPWSSDPVFQTTYFCNVRREDDKVTKFIRAWAKFIHPAVLPSWYTLARMINWPDSLCEVDTGGSIQEAIQALKIRRDSRKQVFSGAYLITTCGVKMDKLNYVEQVCLGVSDLKFDGALPTLNHHHSMLMRVNGLGSFLAAQVVADLKNSPGNLLQDASDWWTFSAIGPGSQKGLNYFFGRDPGAGVGLVQYQEEIQEVRAFLEDAAVLDFRICNQDLQNCLCEFSKFMRVKAGGRSKRLYSGTS